MRPHDETTTGKMTTNSPPSSDASRPVRRRRFLALGLGAGATMLAGCSGDGGTESPSGREGDGVTTGSSTDTASSGSGDVGTFRLLISDRPNAIGDFDSLEVSFDRARVFRSGGDDEATATPAGTDETGTAENGTGTPTSDVTATPTTNATNATTDDGTDDTTPTPATETPDDDAGDGGGSDGDDAGEDGNGVDDGGDAGGFTTMDLGGATVDLTEVVGSKAKGIFESGLPAGRYTKIELHAAEIEGVVDGEPADVKLPSEKLMLTRPFDVVAGSTVSFVFDISVVKKGNGGYNLLPVVSESGVAGKDVEVEEVNDDRAEDGTETEDAETDDGGAGDADGDADGDAKGDADGDGTPTDENATAAS